MDEPIGQATPPDPNDPNSPQRRQERADVKRWQERIRQARKHDDAARAQYAKDRRYARGDSGFDVDANLIGTYIDISESFLYAKNPDVDVLPAESSEPPDTDTIREAAQAQAEQAAPPPAMGMLSMIAGPMDPMMQQALLDEQVNAHVERVTKAYRKRQREMKAFAETLELVISQLWQDASLKKRARRMVRSTLTTGVGVLKAMWLERTQPDPVTTSKIADLQDNLKKVTALRAEMQESGGEQLEAQQAELQRQLQALDGQAEQVIARGFAVDFVAPENFQIAPGYELGDHLDAPWNAHRIPMLLEDAKAEFGLTAEKAKQATRYTARKPEMIKAESAMVGSELTERDADAYVAGSDGDGGEWVMVWEIWDREATVVLTTIEGLDCWVKPPWQPCPTTRFYSFFLFLLSEVDGQRHPQSLVTRSMKLADEYNRIGTAEAEHRRRIKPKTIFNAGEMTPEDATKITNGGTQEMIPIKPTNPQADVRNLVLPLAYAQLDPMLYDRARIKNELESIWGIQEALSGAVTVAKTATESEIQQSGFTARTGGRRDGLESGLSEMAQYTAEVARCYVTTEDAIAICGPDAFWPKHDGAESLRGLVAVDIRAGTTGKPNTSAERQAWATQLPLIQSSIMQIGQLRQSTPHDIADCLERLLRITAERNGDRLDVDSLMPQAGPPMPPMMPGAPGMPADPANPDPGAAPAPGPLQPPMAA